MQLFDIPSLDSSARKYYRLRFLNKMPRLKFLLDANLSPETANFMRSLNFDVKSLIEEGLGGLTDSEVIKIAQKERRVIITFDIDFGELYYFAFKKNFGVLVLRLHDQRVEGVNSVLESFFATNIGILEKKHKKLVILTENEVRIIS